MARTRGFKELAQRQVASDPAFGVALLREGVDTMLTGDVDTGKAILRDYIKATIGFEKLGEATGTQPESLIRMFGPRGNPQAKNLFSVLSYLQRHMAVGQLLDYSRFVDEPKSQIQSGRREASSPLRKRCRANDFA